MAILRRMSQAPNSARKHPYLAFEEHTVARILHASHTTQRNAQQCLLIWDRCNDILAYLNSPDRASDPDTLLDRLRQSRFIGAFDAYVIFLHHFVRSNHLIILYTGC